MTTPSSYTLRNLSDICAGDHICCLCNNDEEKWQVLSDFYKRGFERKEKMMFLRRASTPDEVINQLELGGLEGIREGIAKGQFQMKHYSEVYLLNGVFDPNRMIKSLAEETAQALAEGYNALRLTGEMSWAHEEADLTKKLIKYESLLNNYYPDQFVAICFYDTRVFEPGVMLQVLSTHPTAIIKGKLYHNIYYMPPNEYLSPDMENAMLSRWMNNIEERQKVEEQLIASKIEAENAAHAKSCFLASMSHEIRNPTNGIIGSADLLTQTCVSPEQVEFVNIIHSSAKHLYRVVNDVLDFSKIESGKMELAKAPVDIPILVQDSLRLCLFSTQKNLAVSLHSDIHPDTPKVILGDEMRLRQILVNLIGNACKFTDEGAITVSVAPVHLPRSSPPVVRDSKRRDSVSMSDTGQPSSIFTPSSLLPSSPLSVSMPHRPSSPSKKGNGERKREREMMEEGGEKESLHLEFSVSDNGVGISPPDQAKLFQNFTQIDVTRKWAGTGLGLAICKQLVEAMGGQIFVKSVVGKGSTFFFRIPVDLPSSPSPSPSPSSSPFLSSTASSTSTPSSTPTSFSPSSSSPSSVTFLPPFPRLSVTSRVSMDVAQSPTSPKIVPYDFSDESVLVVEDNPANQKVMKYMLEKMKCKVTIACNGLQAIKLAAENKHSIIFMDQYMPECDGFTAGKQIKSDCEKRGVEPPKLIGFTGTFETRLSGVMDAVLVKPVRFETLAELLSKYCRNKFSLS